MADTEGVVFGEEDEDFDLPHCPVCWELTTTESNPVQCRNGHIICVSCSVGLRNCHTCGVMMDPTNPIICVIARHFVEYVQQRKRKPKSSASNHQDVLSESDDKFQKLSLKGRKTHEPTSTDLDDDDNGHEDVQQLLVQRSRHRKQISDLKEFHDDACRRHQQALQQTIDDVRREEARKRHNLQVRHEALMQVARINSKLSTPILLLVMLSLIIFHDTRVYLNTQGKHQIQSTVDNWMMEQIKMPMESVMNLQIQTQDVVVSGIYDAISEEGEVCQLMDDVINDKVDVFRHQIRDSFQQRLHRGIVDIQTSNGMMTTTLLQTIKFVATGTYKFICMLLRVIRMGLGVLLYSIKYVAAGAYNLLGMLLRVTRMGFGSIIRFVRGPLLNAACTLVHASWNVICKLAMDVISPITYSSVKITGLVVSEILRVLICMSDVVVSRYIMG